MSMNDVNGMLKYTETQVSIYFPEGKVCCALCPLLETYARDQCRRSGEYIVERKLRGHYCPLIVKEEEDEAHVSDAGSG